MYAFICFLEVPQGCSQISFAWPCPVYQPFALLICISIPFICFVLYCGCLHRVDWCAKICQNNELCALQGLDVCGLQSYKLQSTGCLYVVRFLKLLSICFLPWRQNMQLQRRPIFPYLVVLAISPPSYLCHELCVLHNKLGKGTEIFLFQSYAQFSR